MSAVARMPEAPAAEPIEPKVKKRSVLKRKQTILNHPPKKLRTMIRRQGGAKVMTIPPALLVSLGADTGTEMALDVKGGKLVAEPVALAPAPRRRYTLDELLQGAEHLPALYASVAGAFDGEAVGHEIG